MSNQENFIPRVNKTWDDLFLSVKSFIKKNNKIPSTIAEDESEKAIGVWWSRQKYNFDQFEEGKKSLGINNKKAKQIRALIKEFPEISRENVWEGSYNKLVEKFEKDGYLWKVTDEDPDIKKLMGWWFVHKTKAKNFRDGKSESGMDEHRCKLVETLIEKLSKSKKNE